MGWPQITYIVLTAIGLGVAVAKDGEPRPPHNFGSTFVATIIVLGLLYAGGFFSGAHG